MTMRAVRWFFVAVAGAMLLTAPACTGPATIVVTVRHAEKEAGSDPGLTAAGQARAQALADRLTGANIKAVYSTDTRRTRATAAPLAAQLGVPVQIYPSPAAIAQRVRAEHEGEPVLVVGHSNTLGAIVQALGADVPDAIAAGIPENDYDNLVTVVLTPDGATAVHSTYGAPSP